MHPNTIFHKARSRLTRTTLAIVMLAVVSAGLAACGGSSKTSGGGSGTKATTAAGAAKIYLGSDNEGNSDAMGYEIVINGTKVSGFTAKTSDHGCKWVGWTPDITGTLSTSSSGGEDIVWNAAAINNNTSNLWDTQITPATFIGSVLTVSDNGPNTFDEVSAAALPKTAKSVVYDGGACF